ncbi:hypothetical protein C464_04673 [Halorubrum coriense DSM 10284]|uniref:Yip1 domain-containing protein n=1 Tax=Halorubrum coriense DSM 10284 TaxID=1227466 RepID=M0ESG2_9EURY|nr:hypothetical protein [Halorubrum coriense]ELZ49359.1 hypothetical protein C464_04673 [Halorubrum coriense DSM 10284]
MVLGAIVSFVVALLVGGLGIYVSGRIVADVDDYSHAVVTALLGAVAWAIGSLIPLIGSAVALVAWVWVIKWRYPGGWKDAAVMGLVAWAAALVVIAVLNGVLGLGISAFGVPGV